ncbi:TPA: ABC transporter ATP-binding protein [Candidatus Collierbacteria bacterium]|uniref:ABC transporter related protein n=1 Tax=Candidatus Collierbacteria bacterium GW2011_GWA2_42_17 TaxID=1618378 RepID=A0A0G1C0U9_9BACT|nr:MAG: ABC transporter related protein [Candidatus Collierbacteria bacterium GW2011_GWB2_42_12]KKS43278.1 MAG: ABC transporter related protein [Candidatus Collierbacteria bacterium GW2011_GWA2_42_17]KKS62814.1 MAG: ABC transporter related protein [Candidatus Collierbacteria bacterium GW2011_GWE2_42_48]KKS63189.1 MAG: ABC transporter related protein [Candidatus Collierbacteria bacterium GW2011_GWD2_42_50]KKS65043.1 MAG: ABC transporter related protein [Candidatus Collierbacteria bacterium GW201
MTAEMIYSPKERPVVAKNISYSLENGEVLLENIELSIKKGDRIALVGKNGAGKSTLMKILAGIIKPTSGSIDYSSVAYVDQLDEGISEVGDKTLMEYISSINDEWWLIQLHYEKLFGKEMPDLSRNLKHFSGGEFMRLKIAIATYKNPEILLLDEPTNHLDIVSKEILRKFIDQFSGGVMIVSHDVHFINEVAKEVWELSDHKLTKHGGNYQDYLQQKATENDARERRLSESRQEVTKAKKALAKEQKRAARSRRIGKKLAGDRSMSKIEKGYFKNKSSASAGRKEEELKENIEQASEKIEANSEKKKRVARISITEGENVRGKRLFNIQEGVLSVDGKRLVERINLLIKYGERLSLAGENGSGKTLLIKAILEKAGSMAELTGQEIFRSPDFSGLYISQRYDQIDREKTLLENMYLANPGIDMQVARKALGNLLFSEKHEVEKLAKTLSGGETARLAFAMASIAPVDILILDEPTNNLDVETIGIITGALKQFAGAILVVSHDIDFLRQIGIEKSFLIKDQKFTEMKTNPSDDGYYAELLK